MISGIEVRKVDQREVSLMPGVERSTWIYKKGFKFVKDCLETPFVD